MLGGKREREGRGERAWRRGGWRGREGREREGEVPAFKELKKTGQ